MNNKEIKEYNDRGNCIYYCKYPGAYRYWYKWNKNNRLINYKSSRGYEMWMKYDENNNLIYITEKEFKEIEFRKKERLEYKRKIEKRSYRFELMEI